MSIVTRLAVSGYRSLRDVRLDVEPLTVVTGANGSGKSSLYRALRLLAETAQGGLVASLAREGGRPSTLWAGPEKFSRAMLAGRQPVQGTVRQESVQLQLGFAADDFGYAIDLGLPKLGQSAFALDPEIKRECIWVGPCFRPAALLVDRRGPSLRTIDEHGAWQAIPQPVSTFESMLSAFADPRTAPEMLAVRGQVRSWRFYDHFRTDAAAPARLPQIGTHTPVLVHGKAEPAGIAYHVDRSPGKASATARSRAAGSPISRIVCRAAARSEPSWPSTGVWVPTCGSRAGAAASVRKWS